MLKIKFMILTLPSISCLTGIILAFQFSLTVKPKYTSEATIELPIVDNQLILNEKDFYINPYKKFHSNPDLENSIQYAENLPSRIRIKFSSPNKINIVYEEKDADSAKNYLNVYVNSLMGDLESIYKRKLLPDLEKKREQEKLVSRVNYQIENLKRVLLETHGYLDVNLIANQLKKLDELKSELNMGIKKNLPPKLISPPSMNESPINPKKSSYMIFGGIIGLFFGIASSQIIRPKNLKGK